MIGKVSMGMENRVLPAIHTNSSVAYLITLLHREVNIFNDYFATHI